MNTFDIYYEWEGDINSLEAPTWVGKVITTVPESVEYFAQTVYPYIHTARVTKVTTCELVESDEGTTYVHLKGESSRPVKIRAPALKYYVWITIVVPVMWLVDSLESFLSMLYRTET